MTPVTGVSARTRVGAILSAALVLALSAAASAGAATQLPSGFRESTPIEDLYMPTAVRFAPDGRVFVAEKSGVIRSYREVSDKDLADPWPETVADLRKQVYNYWDRGMLGLALDPNFATNGYLYVLYAANALPGTLPDRAAPAWPSSDTEGTDDMCPDPPGSLDGCPGPGRLSRLQVDPATGTAGDEKVLVEDWCQQFPTHSVGALAFGADGALYASGGDGAGAIGLDYGQFGGRSEPPDPRAPRNPCGDPPGGVGAELSAPTAEGGALRSQDLRTQDDPTGFSGTLIRIDKPRAGPEDVNPRIVAHGFRNPFRFAIRPQTQDIWLGDVGWGSREEIDRVPDGAGAGVHNFGWPCYEGAYRQDRWDAADLDLCEKLYEEGPGAVTAPTFAYDHGASVKDDGCERSYGSSISALAFYSGGAYPDGYDGALFFGDYARSCLWAMAAGPDGVPDPTRVTGFATGAATPVDLQAGPGGDLFYVDVMGGTVRRIEFFEGNQPPVARAEATTSTSGSAPLTVTLDGRASSDPEGGALSYRWDLDGDREYDDATGATVEHTYRTPGTYQARLRVFDAEDPEVPAALSGTSDRVTISAENTPPDASIVAPAPTTRWRVGERLELSGSASDQQEQLEDRHFSWDVVMHHCTDLGGCHEHPVERRGGKSPSITAPDHEYPSFIELRLKVTDSHGLSGQKTLRLDPQTVELTLETTPEPLGVTLNDSGAMGRLTREVIAGSRNTVSASRAPAAGGLVFGSWSDGGRRTHDVTAPGEDTTLLARYVRPRFDARPTAGPAPLAVGLDGRTPGDPGGRVLSYDWDLDGNGVYDDAGGATLEHMFRVPGQYPVRLRVTDEDRVSAVSEPVTITATSLPPGQPRDDVPVRIERLRVAPTAFQPARGRSGGARLSYILSETASAVVRVKRLRTGRLAGRTCRRKASSNAGGRRCTLATLLPGQIAAPGRPGANRLRFTGWLGERRLAPGSYRLVLIAAKGAGNASSAASAGFRVLR